MKEILLYILNENSTLIDAIGICTAFFPMILAVVFILYSLRIFSKLFKLPEDIKEYRKIKNILKALGSIVIVLLILTITMSLMIFYYLIYYGLFLPKLYGVEIIL